MKIVILCGGKGTRLSEETRKLPKPLVQIGSKPILWHIIKYFFSFGYNEFILASGYKFGEIKKYFINNKIDDCKINVVNTGLNTLTGGRLLRLKKYFKADETFMMTYGDGLSDVNLEMLIKFHYKKKKIATLTAVRPPVRFGELKINFSNRVTAFEEKNQSTKNWINGGFFILNSKIFNFIKDDKTIFERDTVIKLVKKKVLNAYKHFKFWQCMDTMRDKILLNKIWKNRKATWKKW